MPPDRDVWQSTRFEEATFEVGGVTIVDARGQSLDGHLWRFLGKFGETASYFGVDEPAAKLLDRVLDGACLQTTARR